MDTDWIAAILTVLLTLYVYGTWTYDTYKRRNMMHIKPTLPFLGNLIPVFIGAIPLSIYTSKMYKQTKGHRYMGMFEFRTPFLLIRDPEVIKLLAVKHFDHFHDHRVVASPQLDPIFSENLFVLKGKRWREMRSNLTPIFTTAKLKVMFDLLLTCGEQLGQYLEEQYKQFKACNAEEIMILNMKDLYTRYTTDVIINISYGQNINSLKYPENDLYKAGQDITNFTGLRKISIAAYLLFPNLMKLLRIPIANQKYFKFLHHTLMGAINRREQDKEVRPDLVQLLVSMKQKRLQLEEQPFADSTLTCQGIVFLQAGLESSSTILYFLSYELARNPVIQERLQDEIDSMLVDRSDKLTFDALQKMTYLNMVVLEALRKYPTLATIDRVCTEDHTFPETDSGPAFTVKEGEMIQIPVYGLHHDPEYFSDPEKFDPERFSEENKHNIKVGVYLPFGLGPRHCIGQRFALILIKVAIFNLLSRVSLFPVTDMSTPMKFCKKGFLLTPVTGFMLGLKPRKLH